MLCVAYSVQCTSFLRSRSGYCLCVATALRCEEQYASADLRMGGRIGDSVTCRGWRILIQNTGNKKYMKQIVMCVTHAVGARCMFAHVAHRSACDVHAWNERDIAHALIQTDASLAAVIEDRHFGSTQLGDAWRSGTQYSVAEYPRTRCVYVAVWLCASFESPTTPLSLLSLPDSFLEITGRSSSVRGRSPVFYVDSAFRKGRYATLVSLGSCLPQGARSLIPVRAFRKVHV